MFYLLDAVEWVDLTLGLSANSRLVAAVSEQPKNPRPTTVKGMKRHTTPDRCRSHQTTESLVAALREHRGTVVEVD